MPTLKTVVDGFIAAREYDNATLGRLAFWTGHLGEKELSEITPDEVDNALVLLAERGRLKAGRNLTTTPLGQPLAGSTLNRYIGQLASVFKYARRLRLLPRTHVPPTKGVEKAPENSHPDRYLRPEEVERLIKVARVADRKCCRMAALIAVAFCTGLRKNNLLELRWRDVDLEAHTVSVLRTKNRDQAIRMAAFACCSRLMQEHGAAVPWSAIQRGFDFEGERIFLGSTPRGIHRSTQMRRGVLSVKTTKPKQGRTARYDDVVGSDGYFSYAFQSDDPGNHDNTALRESFEDQSPLIYFYALVPGVYQILFPTFIIDWNAKALRCTVAVGSPQELALVAETHRLEEHIDRRYSTIEAKVRLHQAEFQELVLAAYGRRCAISGLPIPDLLQAAHIIPDRDERGRPEVRNGICLSTLHHAAYDRNLLGIDPDGCIHIAPSVLDQHDGPTLEMAIKEYHKRKIHLPRHTEDRPNRDFLAERYDQFRHAA